MEFGVVLQPNPPATGVVAMMQRAEAAGFRYGWTFDSHVLWQETFVLYPRILEETRAMIVGPMVTNPGTRDWSVIASMFATLTDTYGNRMICGIGRGDSARRYIGQPPVSLATLSSAMSVIKGLAEGREVTHHGQPLRIPWVSPGASLPVWMAAYGPKALRLVGEQADGFILQTADPDIARWTVGSVRAAARAAGRDPDDLTICVAAPAYVERYLAKGFTAAAAAAAPSLAWNRDDALQDMLVRRAFRRAIARPVHYIPTAEGFRAAVLAGEHPADEDLHAVLLGQEPAGGVGDRRLVVADLERGDRSDVEPDALIGNALLGDFRLAQRQRQHSRPLLHRHDEAAVAGDNAELRSIRAPLGAGNEQCLVGRRYMPEQHG